MRSRIPRRSTSSAISRSSRNDGSPLSTVAVLYERECARLGYSPDAAQQHIVAMLDELRTRLLAPRKSNGLLK